MEKKMEHAIMRNQVEHAMEAAVYELIMIYAPSIPRNSPLYNPL